jgi:hypothetical protein
MTRRPTSVVYFHDDFDGVASAAIASLYLEHAGHRIAKYQPVHYGLRDWSARRLPPGSAVVDFLFNPTASHWWDHHVAPFKTPGLKQTFHNAPPSRYWDPTATSCAKLLTRLLAADCPALGQPHIAELASWADLIDSARYRSPRQAYLAQAPALRINLGFLADKSDAHLVWLVRQLRQKSLTEVARTKRVETLYQRARRGQSESLRAFKRSAHYQDGVVVFDLSLTPNALFNRYLPYYVFPRAKYSFGILHGRQGRNITAMTNPWLQRHGYRGPNLGKLFQPFGGGGHPRVASIRLPEEAGRRTRSILKSFLDATSHGKISVEAALSHV